jgi:hypothetical protein
VEREPGERRAARRPDQAQQVPRAAWRVSPKQGVAARHEAAVRAPGLEAVRNQPFAHLAGHDLTRARSGRARVDLDDGAARDRRMHAPAEYANARDPPLREHRAHEREERRVA